MLSVTYVSKVCPASIFTECKGSSRLLQNVKKSAYSIITKNTHTSDSTSKPYIERSGQCGAR
jgi:hypothetical protein